MGKQFAMNGLNTRKRLGTTASLLALTVAVQLAATGAMAQTTVAPASRDDQSTPQTDTPQTDNSVPAGAGAGKRPVSGSMSIENQAAPEQSNVTVADVQTPAADQSGGDDIVVTGLRQSLANAQSIKRNADTVVDAITAEDIGALPDRSVNEALQRVPGVAISRFAAPTDSAHFSVEGSGVVIRGLSYVRGEFNGRDSFAVAGGREIGFNDVPSELVGSIEVYKNNTADLIEGGISGTVNINTRKPFDSKGQLLYVSGSMSYGDMAERGAPSVVGLFSKQWDLPGGGRVGFLASGSYSQQFSRSDAVFLAAMLPRYNDDKNGNGRQDVNLGEGRVVNAGTAFQTTLFDTYPVPSGRDSVYVPMGGGIRTQTFDRVRIGAAAAAQYENADRSVLLTAQYLLTDSRQNWIEHTIEPSVGLADSVLIKPVAGTTPTYDANGVFTSGSLNRPIGAVFGNLPNNGGYGQLNQFAPNGGPVTFANRFTDGQAVTQDFALNGKFEPIDRLHLNADVQYVKSTSNSIDDNAGTNSFASYNIDLTGKTPQVTFQPQGRDASAYFANPSSIYIQNGMNNRTDNDGHEWAFRGDAAYDVSEDSFLRKVAVGGRYSTRDQTVRTNDYNNWGSVSDTWTSGGPAGLNNFPNQTELFNFSDFYRNQSNQPPSTMFISDAVMRDHDALTALLRAATKAGGSFYTPLEDRTGLVDEYFRANEYYRNKETTWGGYVRADFGVSDFGNGMSLTGNVGLRFVRTKDESFGALTYPERNQVLPQQYATVANYCADPTLQTVPAICLLTPAQQTAAVAFANGASFPDVATQSFNHWLPSANIKLQVTPTLLFRAAASKAISRPNFGDLRNYVGVTPFAGRGTYGFQAQARNPFLRPVEAKQFDLTAEWYFAKVGSVTGAVFYKELSNIILDNFGYTRPLTNNGQTFNIGVNGPANAPGKGKVKGAEFSYQQTYDFLPGALSGLGTQATFTYVDPSNIPNGVASNPDANNAPPIDTAVLYADLPLTGLSKYNFNVSGFYDKFGIYARIAYSWRSEFLLTNRDCCFPFLPVYASAGGQADASLFYTVNPQFKIGLQVQNLLDQTTKTTYGLGGDVRAPRSFFKSDRQFQVSARLTL